MAQYTRNPPLEADALDPNPLRQLDLWVESARAAGMQEPTAATLATATADGRPSARIVLYKGVDEGGLSFYTNYHSRKGRELAENPFAAMVFWWDRLERQVRVEGAVEPLPRAVSATYFASRPRESQLSAVVSEQSETVTSREALEARMEEAAAHFGDGAIPCPAHWGGYRLRPDRVEFWQGRLGRAHDRLVYLRSAGNQDWQIARLQP